MNDQPVQVAIAILYQEDKFLMQLRDNIPGILYPGYWGLFGGHLELGETPDIALRREVIEEIGYTLPSFVEFACYADDAVVRHVFHAPLLVELKQLVLNEGWDMGLLTPEDIRQGQCYSPIADEIRPLGTIHQRIMLDFISH
ncbi:NUDIX hydrolase [Anabaena sp. CCY 0017]|uniref:NUDIX hydrolase n=1 Tax=Anabaena sp. CCY 0017 TaxID=3103866 RepID=UPI0039C6D813